MSPKSSNAPQTTTTPATSHKPAPTSDSSQPPALQVVSEAIDPEAVLRRLSDHVSRNPFATDRKTVMVAAQGRALTTAMDRLRSIAAEAAKLESQVIESARNALTILDGTHPGLHAGGAKSKGGQ